MVAVVAVAAPVAGFTEVLEPDPPEMTFSGAFSPDLAEEAAAPPMPTAPSKAPAPIAAAPDD